MRQNSTDHSDSGITISVPIPAQNADLYGNGAIDEILLFLSRHPFEQFSQRELARHTDYSEPTVRRGIQTLTENELVTIEHAGNQKLVGINRSRLSVPDDPFLQIPQEGFQEPVKAAVRELKTELTEIVGIVLYGSVARGEADRRSDIDLWVLTQGDRAQNQRRAGTIEKNLEDTTFAGDRYDFHIAVESLATIPSFTDDVSRILRSGITVYKTKEFETVRNLLAHNEYDE